MAIYNIIYRSPDNAIYLWNGSSFDLLGNEENDKLFSVEKVLMKMR